LDSNSISIWTCFLNHPLEFIRTTYPGNLYPIGSSDRLTRRSLEQLTRTPPKPYPIASMLTRLYTFISYRITLPDSSPDRTSTYPSRLPYPISSRSNFCLPDRTRPPYPTSLPGRVTPRCTQLLTRPYPIILPARVPFNWPHPKTSSPASHLDIGLLLVDNASR
jgi:hypothetical protein